MTWCEFHTESKVLLLNNNFQLLDDGHDWYCTECHLAGDVICCTNCHRVFHITCYNNRISNKKSNLKTELQNEYSQKISDLSSVKFENKQNGNVKLTESSANNNEAIDKNQSTNENVGDEETGAIRETETDGVNNNRQEAEVISEGHVSSTAEQNVPTLCMICLLLQNEKDCKLNTEDLNYLLGFTFNRIKMWVSSRQFQSK